MEAGKNSVIYMGLISGPNKADDTCGRTTVIGTMDRGFTVFVYLSFAIVCSTGEWLVDISFTVPQDDTRFGLLRCLGSAYQSMYPEGPTQLPSS
jgi:hypothetical protein